MSARPCSDCGPRRLSSSSSGDDEDRSVCFPARHSQSPKKSSLATADHGFDACPFGSWPSSTGRCCAHEILRRGRHSDLPGYAESSPKRVVAIIRSDDVTDDRRRSLPPASRKKAVSRREIEGRRGPAGRSETVAATGGADNRENSAGWLGASSHLCPQLPEAEERSLGMPCGASLWTGPRRNTQGSRLHCSRRGISRDARLGEGPLYP